LGDTQFLPGEVHPNFPQSDEATLDLEDGTRVIINIHPFISATSRLTFTVDYEIDELRH